MIGAINSGAIQIMASIPSFPWSAGEAGYNLVAIMQNETSHLTPPDSGALIARANTNIKHLKQLEGKKVACLALNSQDCLDGRYEMQQAGVDVSKIQFVQAPFPTHYDLLRNNQVDAVETVDPFTTQILTSGVGRLLRYTYISTVPGQPLGAWWAPQKWVQAHPDIVARFNTSMREAIDWMHAHPNKARQAVADFTHLPASLLDKMPLNNWNYEVDPATWQKEAVLLHKEGALKTVPNQASYFAPEIKQYFTNKNVQYYAKENAKLRPATQG
jgi:NitT/TauT family transport system substrate-binding protein